MTRTIKPIPTVYKDVHFRSRLEARWALFFDALGIEWEYEPEGFEFPSGTRYLPDFWLPKFNGGIFVEVKPAGVDSEKAREFVRASGKGVWLCQGVPAAGPTLLIGPDGSSQAVPCFGRNRLWLNPSDREVNIYGLDMLSAVAEVRTHRFWDPAKPHRSFPIKAGGHP